MAVYKNDRAEWFRQAVESLLSQTLRSEDIVIVVDGPLTPELNQVIRGYESDKTITVTRLKKNQGLGNALNVGIAKAKHELIARMDADDIAVSNRFELQAAEFEKKPNLDILGGQIAEFVGSPDNIVAYRNVPVLHADIKQFSRRRSPFNHPTVMYKKLTIQSLGGYDVTATRIEDYDLWLRALSADVRTANLDTVLLKYRSTVDAMKRRKTIASLKSHIKARARFFREKHISFFDFCYGVVTQTVLFVLPSSVADLVFKKTVRSGR
ncbi:glycosyltransferase [Candidatus Saccharibacteria bacterium]|nr:glycosyltransferase [Candidatus Saccharibacteria bacterium]